MSPLLLVLIPLLPLIGFLINGLGFTNLPKGAVGIIGCLTVIGSFVLSVVTFNAFLAGGSQPIILPLFDWITVGNLNIPFSFQIDQLSLLMLMIITGVGSLIHIYSIGYMKHDDIIGSQNQQQHEKQEEVQISKKLAKTGIMMHVTD